jgi:hypothetical protein
LALSLVFSIFLVFESIFCVFGSSYFDWGGSLVVFDTKRVQSWAKFALIRLLLVLLDGLDDFYEVLCFRDEESLPY